VVAAAVGARCWLRRRCCWPVEVTSSCGEMQKPEDLELEGNSWDRDEGGCLLWRPNGSAPVRGRGWAVGTAGSAGCG